MILNNFYKGKKVLITGHTGFKGAWLSLWLESLGAKVIGYSLKPKISPNLFELAEISSGIISIIGDVKDKDKMKEIIQEHKPEIIFHLAAQALVLEGYSNPIDTFETNIMGTANILESIRDNQNVRAFIGVTSDKCYENNDKSKPFSEEDSLGGNDPYSSSKACAELVINAYNKSFFEISQNNINCGIASVRAGNVIGGGDWSPNRLVPDCINSLERGEDILLRYPNSTRPWQHVLDPLYGYMSLAFKLYNNPRKFSGPWNFGPTLEHNVTVIEVARKICLLWGEDPDHKIKVMNSDYYESVTLSLDSTKSEEVLGWCPRLEIDKSLEFTVSWYKNFFSNSSLSRNSTIDNIKNYE